MAGLIARLFGGAPSPAEGPAEPAPGVGGYTQGAGRTGQNGFPGSTSSTRTFRGSSPRAVKLDETAPNTPDMRMGVTPQTRQVSFRGDQQRDSSNPRLTPSITLAQTRIVQELQHNSPAEWFGGEPLKTRTGNLTVGGHPLSRAQEAGGHSERDTTTPWTRAQPEISGGVPGSANVRNTIAQRYKNPPGQLHAYKPKSRADQPGSTPSTAATGAEVLVPNRFVFDGGGVQSWSVLREMPYGGRGNGARGAQLNGQRYYATGQDGQFMNAGQGEYGARRLAGGKQAVSFDEPAPWTTGNYLTTDQVQSGATPQAPGVVTLSPSTGRASNTPSYRGGS